MQFFEKRKQVFILIIAAMLIADFVLFGYLPSHRRMKSVKQAKAEQMQIITKASIESRQISDINLQLQKLRDNVEGYEQSVPSQRDLGVFLQQITNLMSKNNLTEQSVAPGNEIESEQVNCIPVNMKCKGRLGQIFHFFQQLQESGRLVRIERVSLKNDAGLTGEVTMEAHTVIYYRTDTG